MKICIILLTLSFNANLWALSENSLLEIAFSSSAHLEKSFYKTLPQKKGFYIFGNKELGYYEINSKHGIVPILSYQNPLQIYFFDGQKCQKVPYEKRKTNLAKWLEKNINIKVKGELKAPFYHLDSVIGDGKKIVRLSVIFNKFGEIINVWDEDKFALVKNDHAYHWSKKILFAPKKVIKIDKRENSWFTHDYKIIGNRFFTIENYTKFVRPHWNFLTPPNSIGDFFKKIKFLLGPGIPIRLNSIVGFDLKTGHEVYRWDSTHDYSIYDSYKYGIKKFIKIYLENNKDIPKKGFDFLHINSLNDSQEGLIVSLNEIDKMVILDRNQPKVLKEYDLSTIGVHNQHHILELRPGTYSVFNNNFHESNLYPDSPYGPSEAVIFRAQKEGLERMWTVSEKVLSTSQGSFFRHNNFSTVFYSGAGVDNNDLVVIYDQFKKPVGRVTITHHLKKHTGAYRVTPFYDVVNFKYGITPSKQCQKALQSR